jgi:hypothetical protein
MRDKLSLRDFQKLDNKTLKRSFAIQVPTLRFFVAKGVKERLLQNDTKHEGVKNIQTRWR